MAAWTPPCPGNCSPLPAAGYCRRSASPLAMLNSHFNVTCKGLSVCRCVSILRQVPCMPCRAHPAAVRSCAHALTCLNPGTRAVQDLVLPMHQFIPCSLSSKWPQEQWLPGDSSQVIMRMIIIENLLRERNSGEMGQSWCCDAFTWGTNLHSYRPQRPLYLPNKAWGHVHLSQKISLYDKNSKHSSSFQYSNIWTSEIFI